MRYCIGNAEVVGFVRESIGNPDEEESADFVEL
jgi:hypothetical protein